LRNSTCDFSLNPVRLHSSIFHSSQFDPESVSASRVAENFCRSPAADFNNENFCSGRGLVTSLAIIPIAVLPIQQSRSNGKSQQLFSIKGST